MEEQELQRSLEIDRQFPMSTHKCESCSDSVGEPSTSHMVRVPVDTKERVESMHQSMLSFRQIVREMTVTRTEADSAKVRAAEMSTLPKPLTRVVLDKAYVEQGPGAEKSIETSLLAWCESKLGTQSKDGPVLRGLK